MDGLKPYLIRANSTGLGFALAATWATLFKLSYIPWPIVISIGAFFVGVLSWALGKTTVSGWLYRPGNYDPEKGEVIDMGRAPMPAILFIGEVVGFASGCMVGFVFLFDMAK